MGNPCYHSSSKKGKLPLALVILQDSYSVPVIQIQQDVSNLFFTYLIIIQLTTYNLGKIKGVHLYKKCCILLL